MDSGRNPILRSAITKMNCFNRTDSHLQFSTFHQPTRARSAQALIAVAMNKPNTLL